MTDKEIRYAVVKATFYAQLLLESLDEVATTPVFTATQPDSNFSDPM